MSATKKFNVVAIIATHKRQLLVQKYVDAIEQNALSQRVSGLSGGSGTDCSRRRVDGSST